MTFISAEIELQSGPGGEQLVLKTTGGTAALVKVTPNECDEIVEVFGDVVVE